MLVILMTACAGNDSSDNSSNTSQNAEPAGQDELVSSTDAGSSGAAQVEPTQEPLAAIVNGEPVTMAEFERERARRAVGMDVQPATQAAFDTMVMQSLIDQMLIEQYATSQGISVSDADIDAELAIQEEIAQANGQTLEASVAAQQYTMDEYREVLRGALLWARVSEQVIATVPLVTTQVHSRHILVADEATARMLLDQLNQGADFAQLAIQYSLDGSSAPSGGDLDWVSRGDLLQPEVEEAIFALEPGQRAPDPVRSSLGYHIVETLERVDERPLDQAKLAKAKEQAFLDWLQNQRDTAAVEQYVGIQPQ